MSKVKCQKSKVNTDQRGQSLIELVVVIAVVVIVLGALTFATIASLRNASFSGNQAQATKLAQEGIERVRIGRDRNQCILLPPDVASWNGANTSCPGGSIWEYQIDRKCGDTHPANNATPTYCYFNVTSQGALNYLTAFQPRSDQAYPVNMESIPPFSRTVIISDDASTSQGMASSKVQKTVTVIVKWSDFAGTHESRLTTILRKI